MRGFGSGRFFHQKTITLNVICIKYLSKSERTLDNIYCFNCNCMVIYIQTPLCSPSSSSSSPLHCSSPQLCGFSDVHYGHFIDWIFANKLVEVVRGAEADYFMRGNVTFTPLRSMQAPGYQETSVVSYYTYCMLWTSKYIHLLSYKLKIVLKGFFIQSKQHENIKCFFVNIYLVYDW